MKIRCDREKFLSAFSTVSLFAPAKSPKEILQNVKLDVGQQACTLSATDLEVGACINVDGVEVDKPGAVIFPTGRIGSLLRESSDEQLAIEVNAKSLLIRGDRSEFKLPITDPAEFPGVPAFDSKSYHELPAALFRQIITRTEFATEIESSRYALGGVLVELDANRIVAIGTDGRRLAKMEGPAKSVGGHKTGDTLTIIRTQSLQRFNRAILDSDQEIQLVARTNEVLIRTPRATFYSRLVEGRFPRWRDVFPNRRDQQTVPFTVGSLAAVIRQASVMTSNDSRGVDFSFSPGTLTLMTSTADIGQAQVELPIAYEGPNVVVTLDHRFVTDFLKVLSPEANITAEFEGSQEPVVFKADDDRYGYVVMPLLRER